jgi:Na+/alanine symporter
MTLPNLIGMLLMHKEVKQMTKEYWHKVRMIQPKSPEDS